MLLFFSREICFYLPETAELHESYPLMLNVQTIDAIKLRFSLYLLYVFLLFMGLKHQCSWAHMYVVGRLMKDYCICIS